MKKRIVSLITTIVLVITMFSTLVISASAAEATDESQLSNTVETVETADMPDSVEATTTTAAKFINIFKFNDSVVYGDPNATTGFIFYPGGNVSYKDYAPLLMAIAQKGYLVVSVKMPLNYAILNIPAASVHMRQFPNVKNWFIGGHSLGGAMAATYANYHSNDLDGLVLLAAYSTKDLTKKGMGVLAVYGSNDGVLNMDSYNKYRSNLPVGFTEKIIEGGNHGQFGNYGFQSGDNEATISALEQVDLTASYVNEFFMQNIS